MSPSDKQIIFSLIGVGRVYPPKKQVLKDIYLSFYYGAKIGVLGLNGSGKSTLLRIIAGVDKDYLGEVTFAKGYSVGLLEQEPLLATGKTVKDIVEETVQERWRLDKFERSERVRDDILKKTPAVGVTLDERDVLVTEENRILRVLIRWSYRFLVFRGDALISIPISYDKAFEVPPGR